MRSFQDVDGERNLSQENSSSPPAGRTKRPRQYVGTVSVFESNDCLNGMKFIQDLSVQSVQLGWALLLRAYLSEETISVARLTASHGDSLDSCSKTTDIIDISEASICQYQALVERQSGKYSPDSERVLTPCDGEENRVNTAVFLCSEASASCGWSDEARSSGLQYRYLRVVYKVCLSQVVLDLNHVRSGARGPMYGASRVQPISTQSSATWNSALLALLSDEARSSSI